MTAAQFPVRIGAEWKHAECSWGFPPAHAEIALLKAWSDLVGSTAEIDAAELAHLAAVKWDATCKWGTVAKSFGEMKEIIRQYPTAEITGMLLARANWSDDGLLGVCLFHRTWARNVFVDFLAVNPSVMAARPAINGIGLGLLYHLCGVARDLGSPIIWGETTADSVSYYQKCFVLPKMGDQLIVHAEARDAFSRGMRKRWDARAAS